METSAASRASRGQPCLGVDDLAKELQRIAAVTRLRPGFAERYAGLHQAVWPSVEEAMRQANITNYSIFKCNSLLLSYFEYSGDDFASDMEEAGRHEDSRRWWELTSPCQMRLDGRPGDLWTPAQEIYHFEGDVP